MRTTFTTRFSRLLPLLVLLACSACAQKEAIVQSGNIYHNPALGLTVEKPASWGFVTAEQSMQNRKNVAVDNEAMERRMQDPASLPTVAISKHPEPHPTINPTFQIKHAIKPSPDITARHVLEAAIVQMRRAYGEFAAIGPIQDATLSGHPAVTLEAEFILQTVTGEMFPVHSRMWVVERDNELFIVGMSGPGEGEDQSTEEFDRILSSVRITD